ncbi:MAG: glycosyl transferase [Pseudolabrys sp.]|nr:glycosyl transferase [Pseudolabrys sp.]
MLTCIISSNESERVLVPTLAALVPGAVSGLVTEVIIADAGRNDAVRDVADVAGARFMTSSAALGPRLRDAAAAGRTPWLMFLRAGTVPDPSWVNAVETFVGEQPHKPRAAAFRAQSAGLKVFLRLMRPRPEQGLLIARSHYDAIGGHRDRPKTEIDLMRRAGRIVLLPARAAPPR